MTKRKDRMEMATVVAMMPKGKKSGAEAEGGPAIKAVTEPLAWTCWGTPDRVAVQPDIRNETGSTFPRLLLRCRSPMARSRSPPPASRSA
jgi:hypothetical protein